MSATPPNLTDMHILLASNSPRRRELLSMIVPEFSIAEMHDIDETHPDNMPAHEIPVFLSKLKAEAYRHQLHPGELMITADTVVINHGIVLGKPHSREEAIEMLSSLRGKTHSVVTGVTLSSTTGSTSFAEQTFVTFSDISDDEITQYVDRYAPFDKAGAYGIQEWIGAVAISGINGCYYNVMGLPLHSLYNEIRKLSEKI